MEGGYSGSGSGSGISSPYLEYSVGKSPYLEYTVGKSPYLEYTVGSDPSRESLLADGHYRGGAGFLKLAIPGADRRIRLDSTGTVRTKSRQTGNGIRIGDKSISPKADIIMKHIMEKEGIHLVYSQFINNGLDFVREKLEKLGMRDIL